MKGTWYLDPTDPRILSGCEGEQFRQKFWVRNLLGNCQELDSDRKKELFRTLQNQGLEALEVLRASSDSSNPVVATLAQDAVKLLLPEEIGKDLAAGLAREEDNYPLELGAALLSRLQYPDLEVEDLMQGLESLADKAEEFVAEGLAQKENREPESRSIDALFLLGEFWRSEEFQGNTEEYYDPLNSWLPDVLERKVGIPITLSVVFMALCKRIGLKAEGVGLPFHFVVRVAVSTKDSQGFLFLDPFQGARPLDLEDCRKLVESSGVSFDPDEHLKALPPREILVRMCNNLLAIYDNKGKLLASERVATVLIHMNPENPVPYLIRAERRWRRGELRLARKDLQYVLGLKDLGIMAKTAEQMLQRIDIGYSI